MSESETKNLLFICSKNRWRSPTAEKVFSDRPGIATRSAGTSTGAVRQVNAKDLKWANIVFVMENKHKQRLKSDFPGETKYKKIVVLDIPDDYKFMAPELIVELENSVDAFLD